jgi:CNT family concentrative nucleoside transporter
MEPSSPPIAPTPRPPIPLWQRTTLAGSVVLLAVVAITAGGVLGQRGQAALGVLCFLGTAAVFSTDWRAINWRTVGWGFALQLLLALFVFKFEFSVGGETYRPGYAVFEFLAAVAGKFLAFSDVGARFVFGPLAEHAAVNRAFAEQKGDPEVGFIFFTRALPTIIFVSSFFAVLYYLGVLQRIVQLMAWAMTYLMRTSGAETLSVAANVVMGQTEAPLLVKPYVDKMTQSELFALMVSGMAHISGALMAVYIGMGADPVAILTTSVMASPCSLYLAKVMLPETEEPLTRGLVKATVEQTHRNVIDAASAGASDGVRLALNIGGMLIAFLAFIALFDFVLSACAGPINAKWGWRLPTSLTEVFSGLFAPVAYLLGLEGGDVPRVADLLGKKLVANEFVAYSQLQKYKPDLSARGLTLATFALTGFANFASIGIQIGGIGALAPSRRADLARLGPRALLTGFLVTLVNAALAGVLL